MCPPHPISTPFSFICTSQEAIAKLSDDGAAASPELKAVIDAVDVSARKLHTAAAAMSGNPVVATEEDVNYAQAVAAWADMQAQAAASMGNAIIAAVVFAAVEDACTSSDSARKAIGKDAVAFVVDHVTSHLTNAGLVASGVRAVGLLCAGNNPHSYERMIVTTAAEHGVVPLLINVFEAHAAMLYTLAQCCRILQLVAKFEASAPLLVEYRAAEHVMRAMRGNVHNEGLFHQGADTLYTLICQGDEVCAQVLGQVDLFTEVVRGSVSAASPCACLLLDAVGIVADTLAADGACDVLVNAGMPRVLVSALNVAPFDEPMVAAALGTLVSTAKDEAFATRTVVDGVVPAITAAVSNFPASALVCVSAVRLMTLYCSLLPAIPAMVAAGSIRAVADLIRANIDGTATLVSVGSQFLRALVVTGSREALEAIRACGDLVPSLLAALDAHGEAPTMWASVTEFLLAYWRTCDEPIAELKGAPAVQRFMRPLNAFPEFLDVIEACISIVGLAAAHVENIPALSDRSVLAVLLQLAATHAPEAHPIFLAAAETICKMLQHRELAAVFGANGSNLHLFGTLLQCQKLELAPPALHVFAALLKHAGVVDENVFPEIAQFVVMRISQDIDKEAIVSACCAVLANGFTSMDGPGPFNADIRRSVLDILAPASAKYPDNPAITAAVNAVSALSSGAEAMDADG